MEKGKCNSLFGRNRKRYLVFIACLFFVLQGCATTNDPRQGGFFSSLHALSTGAYEERLNRKQLELEEARRTQGQLKKGVIQSGDEVAGYSKELKTAERQLLIFQSDLDAISNSLYEAAEAEKIEDNERLCLETEISSLRRKAAQISKERLTPSDEKINRIKELENQRRELEVAFKAALTF